MVKNLKLNILLISILYFLSTIHINSQENNKDLLFEEQMRRAALNEFENPFSDPIPTNSPKTINLTIEDAVRYVIANNITVQNAKYEIIKSDSPEYKNESRYVWKVIGNVSVARNILPFNNLNFFSGSKIHRDRVSAGIEKQFSSGTFFKVEAYTERFDTNAFENPFTTPPAFQILGIPPIYTGGLSFTLSQELYKNSFGKSDENTRKILKTQTELVRNQMIDILTGLVVKVLIDYWTLAIYDSQIQTFENLISNTEEVRKITIRKQTLGLSESFEVNQWNSLILKYKSNLEKLKIERSEKERELIRILNVSPNSTIAGVTDLTEEPYPKVNIDDEKKYAISHRLDYIRILKAKKMAELGLENALMEDNPSIKASLKYGSISQTFEGPQTNWIPPNGVFSFLHPQLYAELKLDYPLWNEAIKSEIQAAKIETKNLEWEETQLKREIEDEVEQRYENIKASYKILIDAKKTLEENKKFYNSLLNRFRQGRFDSITIKQAMDAVANSESGVTQAKINYNINILLYELSKNYIFEKYGVDIYRILEEAEKEASKKL